MPKTAARTTVAHRGPRHEGDPDRRVKYTLRFRRRGEEVEPRLTLVRRGRRSTPKQVAPKAAATSRREQRRRERHQVNASLGEVAKHVNAAS